MTVYVVTGNDIEKGQFKSFRGETVHYMTKNGMKAEHTRNVFFNRRNARYHLVRSLGIFRPILNGTSS